MPLTGTPGEDVCRRIQNVSSFPLGRWRLREVKPFAESGRTDRWQNWECNQESSGPGGGRGRDPPCTCARARTYVKGQKGNSQLSPSSQHLAQALCWASGPEGRKEDALTP